MRMITNRRNCKEYLKKVGDFLSWGSRELQRRYLQNTRVTHFLSTLVATWGWWEPRTQGDWSPLGSGHKVGRAVPCWAGSWRGCGGPEAGSSLPEVLSWCMAWQPVALVDCGRNQQAGVQWHWLLPALPTALLLCGTQDFMALSKRVEGMWHGWSWLSW